MGLVTQAEALKSPTLLVLALLSMAALALGAERALFLHRLRSRLAQARASLLSHLDEGTAQSAQALNGSLPMHAATPVFAAVLRQDGPGVSPEARRLVAAVGRLARRRMWLLGSLASLSPFVGLLGTVLGIMRAFTELGDHGEGGLSVVGRGVGEALVSTAVGIAVAIEAVLLFNYLQALSADALAECKEATEELAERQAAENGA